MDRIDYRGALARGWWLMVVLGIAGLAVGILMPIGKAQKLKWSTTTFVGAPPPAISPQGSPIPPSMTTDQILFFADSDSVFAQAGQLANLNVSIPLMRGQVTVTGPSGTSGAVTSGQAGVVQVTVNSPTVAESVALNNGFDDALGIAVANATEKAGVSTGYQVLQATADDQASQIKAKATSKILASRPVRGLAGLLIGLLLGVLVALAAALLDKRLSTAQRAQGAFGYPVLAEIPYASSDSSEAYRKLWLSIFREPLSLPVEQQDDWWIDGADPMLDPGSGSRSGL